MLLRARLNVCTFQALILDHHHIKPPLTIFDAGYLSHLGVQEAELYPHLNKGDLLILKE